MDSNNVFGNVEAVRSCYPDLRHSVQYLPPHNVPTQAARAQPKASTSRAGGREVVHGDATRLVMQSCERCRSRRSRCVTDEIFGICRACWDSGAHCIYTGIDKRRQSTKQLRARLAYLEDVFSRLRTTPNEALPGLQALLRTGAGTGVTPTGLPAATDQAEALPSTAQSTSPSSTGSVHRRISRDWTSSASLEKGKNAIPLHLDLPRDGSQELIFDRAIVESSWDEVDEGVQDQIDRLDRLAVLADGSIHAFGPTSNLAFSLEATALLGVSEKGEPATGGHGDRHLAEVRHLRQSRNDWSQRPILVPPGTDMATVEHLLHTYYVWHLPVFPILSRVAFTEDFHKGGGVYFSSCLLNAILALASLSSDLPSVRTHRDKPETAGEAYFALAKQLLEPELDAPSITTVQALALISAREKVVCHDRRSFMYAGMACRLALALGLHLDPTPLVNQGVLTERDASIRSYTFQGLQIVDSENTLVSAGPSATFYGLLITCILPEAVQGEDFDWWSSVKVGSIVPLTPHRQEGGSVFPHFLHDASATSRKLIQDVYYARSPRSPAETRMLVSRLTRETLEKVQKLPSIASPASVQGQPGFLSLLVSCMVYHAIILLINRPFLYDIDPGANDTPRERCLWSAFEIIRIIGVLRDATSFGVRTSQHCMQYAMTTAAASLVCELEMLDGDVTGAGHSRRTMIQQALKDAEGLLEEMASRLPAAGRALRVIHNLRQQHKSKRVSSQKTSTVLSPPPSLHPAV